MCLTSSEREIDRWKILFEETGKKQQNVQMLFSFKELSIFPQIRLLLAYKYDGGKEGRNRY